MIIQSKNGSGKTLTYSMILIHNLLKSSILPLSRTRSDEEELKVPIKALVITPTREIAIQVKDYIAFLLRHASLEEIPNKSILLGIGGLDIKE